MAELHFHISLTNENSEFIMGLLNNSTYLDNSINNREETAALCASTEAEAMRYKYRERVTVGTDSNGKPVIKWAVGNTKAELQDSIARLKGPSAEPSLNTDVLFKDYAENWMETYRRAALKDSTFEREKYRVDKLVKAFGERPISSITPDDVQRYLNTMREKTFTYVRDILNTLKKLFDDAEADGQIPSNPARNKKIKNPAKGKQPPRELKEEERGQVKAAIPTLEKREDRIYLALCYYTGMRPGEVLALRWEDIDRANGVIHVRRAASRLINKYIISDPKTASGHRDVPLLGELVTVLEPFEEIGYLFHDERGDIYTEQMKRRMVERIKKKTGIDKRITSYFFRHNYATMMAEVGVTQKATQAIMGHANPTTTMMYYQHVTPTMIKGAREQMQSAFACL